MQSCQGCAISFIAIHYYGPPDGLSTHVNNIHSQYPNSSIWVTEFGFPQLSPADTVAALQSAIDFFDTTDFVDRYAYFPAYRVGDGNDFLGQGGAVLDDGGAPNDVGRLWLGTPSSKVKREDAAKPWWKWWGKS